MTMSISLISFQGRPEIALGKSMIGISLSSEAVPAWRVDWRALIRFVFSLKQWAMTISLPDAVLHHVAAGHDLVGMHICQNKWHNFVRHIMNGENSAFLGRGRKMKERRDVIRLILFAWNSKKRDKQIAFIGNTKIATWKLLKNKTAQTKRHGQQNIETKFGSNYNASIQTCQNEG